MSESGKINDILKINPKFSHILVVDFLSILFWTDNFNIVGDKSGLKRMETASHGTFTYL